MFLDVFFKITNLFKNKVPLVSDAYCCRRFGSGGGSSENYPMVIAPSERTEAAHTRIQPRSSPAKPAKLVSMRRSTVQQVPTNGATNEAAEPEASPSSVDRRNKHRKWSESRPWANYEKFLNRDSRFRIFDSILGLCSGISIPTKSW